MSQVPASDTEEEDLPLPPPVDPAYVVRLMAVQAVVGEPDSAVLRAVVLGLTPYELREFLSDLHSRPLERAVLLARAIIKYPRIASPSD